MKDHYIRKTADSYIVVALLALGVGHASAGDGWEKARFGRLDIDQLTWSVDPAVAKAFLPSGVGDRILRCGEFTILYNHGLYFSDAENQDTSHDMRASVIVFKGDQRVFVARGYKFSDFKCDAAKKAITFDYWTGVMGDRQIQELTLDLGGNGIQCTTRFFSTKDSR